MNTRGDLDVDHRLLESPKDFAPRNNVLSQGLIAYKRTPTFDQESLPAGLRREHRTKVGVWALIQVIEGHLRQRILDPLSEEVLTPETPGVVRPAQPHEVESIGPVRLFVEFFSARTVQGGPHSTQVL